MSKTLQLEFPCKFMQWGGRASTSGDDLLLVRFVKGLSGFPELFSFPATFSLHIWYLLACILSMNENGCRLMDVKENCLHSSSFWQMFGLACKMSLSSCLSTKALTLACLGDCKRDLFKRCMMASCAQVARWSARRSPFRPWKTSAPSSNELQWSGTTSMPMTMIPAACSWGPMMGGHQKSSPTSAAWWPTPTANLRPTT